MTRAWHGKHVNFSAMAVVNFATIRLQRKSRVHFQQRCTSRLYSHNVRRSCALGLNGAEKLTRRQLSDSVKLGWPGLRRAVRQGTVALVVVLGSILAARNAHATPVRRDSGVSLLCLLSIVLQGTQSVFGASMHRCLHRFGIGTISRHLNAHPQLHRQQSYDR